MTLFFLILALGGVSFITYGAHKALAQGSSEDALSGLPIIGVGFLLLIVDGMIWVVWLLVKTLG